MSIQIRNYVNFNEMYISLSLQLTLLELTAEKERKTKLLK